jgi:hypothetical protein
MTYDKQNTEPGENGKSADLDKYVRLRTILDSLEFGAIKYFLKTTDGKGERFDELSSQLMPIIDWLWKKDQNIECPEGYMDCHVVCVPYPCPDPGGY